MLAEAAAAALLVNWPSNSLPYSRFATFATKMMAPSVRARLALAFLLARPCVSHWHEEWEAGQTYSYPWYEQPWVARVNTFYCDEDCAARLEVAPTVDREFKALVELLNQTTGGPRNPYRGAFEGLDEYVEGQLNGPELSRQAASLATWKHMEGWDSILSAHTSARTLCTELKLDGNESFTRQLCYDKIFASDGGPLFPSPRCAPLLASPLPHTPHPHLSLCPHSPQ